MARQLRTILQEATYHCYSKCHDNQNFFLTEAGKQFLVKAIQMCQGKYTFELNGIEVVDNHIHLVIRTLNDGETISRIMQYIKARTGEQYNKSFHRKGAFWIGRFGCRIVEESDIPEFYLFWLLWYVAYNPVKKGLCSDPRKSYIGFINCYLIEGYQLPIKITLHPYFCRLGNTFDECVEKFLLYEEAYTRRLANFQ